MSEVSTLLPMGLSEEMDIRYPIKWSFEWRKHQVITITPPLELFFVPLSREIHHFFQTETDIWRFPEIGVPPVIIHL